EKSWLIFADASGVGEGLASQLRKAGVRCRVARHGDHFAPDGADTSTLRAEVLDDWKQLLHECADDAPPERFVYLWSLDEPRTDAKGDAALMGTDALLHLMQVSTESNKPPTKRRIDLVTRGAQPAGRAMNATSVAQSPVIGLMRVIRNENQIFRGRE